VFLCFCGSGGVGAYLEVNLVAVLCIVVEGSLGLFRPQTKLCERAWDSLTGGDVSSHQPAYNLPDVRAADQPSTATGSAVAKCD
jgi:hypothetical protein